ncbi:MAG: hypothetical protein OXI96_04835 [Acidimicrobiaceae bacterium]|nr:hypothetical protein [Acidimicrobiaceae bacterium]
MLKVHVQLALSNKLRVRQGRVELIRVENIVRQTDLGIKYKKIRRQQRSREIFIQNENIYGMRSIDVTLSIPSDVIPTMRGVPVAGRLTGITWEIVATLETRSFKMNRLITHGIVILPPYDGSVDSSGSTGSLSCPVTVESKTRRCCLSLFLSHENVSSNDKIEGVFCVEALKGIQASEAKVSLIRRELYGDTLKTIPVEELSLGYNITLPEGQGREWPFQLNIPEVDAPSMRLKDLYVEYRVEARLDIPMRRDPVIIKEIHVKF